MFVNQFLVQNSQERRFVANTRRVGVVTWCHFAKRSVQPQCRNVVLWGRGADHGSGAIKCFECNSHNDSRCSLDVLPVELKKDCSEHKEGTKYTMCRKIVQHIDFEVNGSTYA
uniref:Uncharacterized protein n=1 Tax=Timema cristinae TaxID=61476 RepID=A0A7R9H6Y0_TIMCR|nr:unnamed protein product [Timema cristinae]